MMRPSEVCELIGMSNELLKKYSLMLEQNGWNIERNSRQHRQYSNRDVDAIKCIGLLKDKGKTIDKAVSLITSSDFDIDHCISSLSGEVATTEHMPTTGIEPIHNGIPVQMNDIVTMLMEQNVLLHQELTGVRAEMNDFKQMISGMLEGRNDNDDEEFKSKVLESLNQKDVSVKSDNLKLQEMMRAQNEMLMEQRELIERLTETKDKSWLARVFGKQ